MCENILATLFLLKGDSSIYILFRAIVQAFDHFIRSSSAYKVQKTEKTTISACDIKLYRNNTDDKRLGNLKMLETFF